MFDMNIKKTIEAAVEAKVKELVPSTNAKDGRARELDTQLNMALQSLFARIERGMTVEIRFLPPNTTSETGGPAEPASASAVPFTQFAEVVPRLVFPPPAADPILSLPRSQGLGSA
jgi:hypothetical protein